MAYSFLTKLTRILFEKLCIIFFIVNSYEELAEGYIYIYIERERERLVDIDIDG